MHRIFYPFIVLIIFLAACQSDDTAEIRLQIDHAEGSLVYFEELRYAQPTELASLELKRSGKAKFQHPMRNPGYYQIRFDNGINQVLVLLPGDEITIKADMDNFHGTRTIEGSELSSRVAFLHDSLRSTNSLLRRIQSQYTALDSAAGGYSEQKKLLQQEYEAIRKSHHRYSQGFILEDLTSLANIAALYQEHGENDFVMSHTQDLQFFKLVSDSLGKYYPRVAYVKALRDNYKDIFTQYQQSRLLQLATPLEENVPNLQLPGPGGKLHTIDELRGKVVLVSFWSVNQPESREYVVQLRRVYQKHAGQGFEIYQVSVDPDPEAWIRALRFEEIPWVNVIDTAFANSKTRMLYNVTKIPMNYLIDTEQDKILAKNISPDMLDRILSGIFNN